MVTQNRIWFSRRRQNLLRRVETENDFPRTRVAQFGANYLFDKNRIRSQSLQDALLLMEPPPGVREFGGAGRLILLQLAVFRLGFNEERARADSECGQENDIKQDDEAARVQQLVLPMNIIGGTR